VLQFSDENEGVNALLIVHSEVTAVIGSPLEFLEPQSNHEQKIAAHYPQAL
jgi:hypothetical protein